MIMTTFTLSKGSQLISYSPGFIAIKLMSCKVGQLIGRWIARSAAKNSMCDHSCGVATFARTTCAALVTIPKQKKLVGIEITLKPLPALEDLPTLEPLPTLEDLPTNETLPGVYCDKGHKLLFDTILYISNCVACDERFEIGHKCWNCDICEYNLCDFCYDEKFMEI